MRKHGPLIEKLLRIGETDPSALVDLMALCRLIEVEDSVDVDGEDSGQRVYDDKCFNLAHDTAKRLRKVAAGHMRNGSMCGMQVYRDSMLFDAPYFFDEFIRFVEFDRPADKKFYEPRRKQLLPVVGAMQRLADGELDLLAVSLPPGVGKTTLAIFFIAWLAGRRPEMTNLVCSHNNEFLRGMYDEILRVVDRDGEYLWHEVFQTIEQSGTNAKSLRIDFGKRKRFETVQMTARGAQNAGKVRATGLLYCDDLVAGIEEALSAEQMEKLWNVYTTDFRQRKLGGCAELHIATRWSLHDVIGRLESRYGNDPRSLFIRVPALDENEQSNFDYPYGLGYTTKDLMTQRDIMDDASWRALYMNEPIEREGQLYAPDELRRYFTLPDAEPDAIISVVDSKEQGSDYCVMPVAYRYGTDYYIDKFICDNGKPNIIEDRIVKMLCERSVSLCRVESNRGGTIFANNINKAVKSCGGLTSITTKWNQTNKETRILVASGWIKEHCLFLDESAYPEHEYRNAMTMLCGYTMAGRNAHDDVPDAMAELANFAQSFDSEKISLLRRRF